MRYTTKILPSMLSADYGRLREEAGRCERSGADALHLDMMDGHFVPNFSFGTALLPIMRKAVKIPLDVHLMLSNPDRYIDRFMDGGADMLSIHVESDCDVKSTLSAIHARGVKAGLVLKPATSAEALKPYLGAFDFVLVMTVEPGYGGQSFMADMLKKIRAVRELADCSSSGFPIEVDGGISRTTIGACAEAGASMFVAGHSIFKASDMTEEIGALRAAASAEGIQETATNP